MGLNAGWCGTGPFGSRSGCAKLRCSGGGVATVFLERTDVVDAVNYMEAVEGEIKRDIERTVADVLQRWQPRRTKSPRW